jgi:Histidinol-phosphate/aromatic aminotransferase and cobyric acid decarboxylase
MIRSSVQRLAPYTPGEQPKIPGIIKLNTNENAYPPSPKVAEALRSFDAARLARYPDPLCVRLREAILRHDSAAPALPAFSIANIFAGNGSDEVLRLATDAWVENRGGIAYFNPSYSLYPVLTDIREARRVEIPLPKPERFAAETLAALDREKPDLLFIANPNAPTSEFYPKAAIREICENFSGVVVIDEAYGAFAGEDCLELALTLPNAVVSRTMSKAWSLAGIRLGYVIGAEPLVSALYKIKDSYNVNFLTQAAAEAAFSDPAWMLANRAKIIATRDRVACALRAFGWQCADSATNFLWCSPPPPLAAAEIEKYLRAKNIIVRYFPGPTTGAHLRITIGTDSDMDAMLNILRSI